ncbi:hypothetical protein EGW08_017517 [Elysia chlorotica]|uniref:Transmembrane protein n=1 Tax=Elysia chlorotica TaxID=188477 RepID=A0A433SZI5_ELYCH|nr:hypothetical protein EGW08_017517 [Elysia chlorotica]
MMQVQGVARAQHDSFPYSGMRVLGTFHICCGAAIFAFGVLDLVITMTSYDTDKLKYGDDYDRIVSFTVASSPVWCGMWKIVFMVLSILCAALFGPACAVLNGLIAILRHSLDSKDYQWLLALLICFLSVDLQQYRYRSRSQWTTTRVQSPCVHSTYDQTVHVLVNTNKADSKPFQDHAFNPDNPSSTRIPNTCSSKQTNIACRQRKIAMPRMHTPLLLGAPRLKTIATKLV